MSSNDIDIEQAFGNITEHLAQSSETPVDLADSDSVMSVEAPQVESTSTDERMKLISGMELSLTVEAGRKTMSVSEIMDMNEGDVVVLDKEKGDPVSIMVNGREAAKGKMVLADGQFAVVIEQLLLS